MGDIVYAHRDTVRRAARIEGITRDKHSAFEDKCQLRYPEAPWLIPLRADQVSLHPEGPAALVLTAQRSAPDDPAA
ncbi:hypothetical protein OG689_44585 [Kitasatospora sp. NBC_00240]|uniref:hypothetical protein n=1 Tax=Kitasatospora sp. NBC_00240 TaxID=2903567 RepID=UPI00224CDC79|nr:hypothetical protein [Kitasatospora sp. NBC_00240]MCX5216217.1 hypothetical protein [Kitasatospora sp. NBC_00240]